MMTLQIRGMKCAGCAGAVRTALERVPGVVSVSVSHETGTADLTTDPSRPPEATSLSAAVESAGLGMAMPPLTEEGM